MTSLISAAELRDHYDDLVVVDVQYALGGPPSTQLYASGHLPGAAHLAMDTDLAGAPGPGGRHPLPDREVFAAALRRCGIDDDSSVVVYDQQTSLAAARAWWLLRHFGFDRVRVLDGGLAAWQRQGGPVVTDAVDPAPGSVILRDAATGEPAVGVAEAAAAGAAGRLWDVRAEERFRGEVEPIDPVAGHVPGARNAPAAQLLRPDGTFRPASELIEQAAAWGIRAGDTLYCGSGVTAAQAALGLAEAGIPTSVFVGSWSQWITDPSRPVATGPA